MKSILALAAILAMASQAFADPAADYVNEMAAANAAQKQAHRDAGTAIIMQDNWAAQARIDAEYNARMLSNSIDSLSNDLYLSPYRR